MERQCLGQDNLDRAHTELNSSRTTRLCIFRMRNDPFCHERPISTLHTPIATRSRHMRIQGKQARSPWPVSHSELHSVLGRSCRWLAHHYQLRPHLNHLNHVFYAIRPLREAYNNTSDILLGIRGPKTRMPPCLRLLRFALIHRSASQVP